MIGLIKTIIKIKLVILIVIALVVVLAIVMKKCSYCRSLIRGEE
jgi:hypothetical protein